MTKSKVITNEDLIKALPQDRQARINAEVEKKHCKMGWSQSK